MKDRREDNLIKHTICELLDIKEILDRAELTILRKRAGCID